QRHESEPGRLRLHPARREPQQRQRQQPGPRRDAEWHGQRDPPARPLRWLAMTIGEDLRTGPGTAEWALWSVAARIVVTDSRALTDARARAVEFLGQVDRAANRFRPDSELMLVQHLAGTGVDISMLLTDLIEAALDAARLTDGAVDPTVGG